MIGKPRSRRLSSHPQNGCQGIVFVSFRDGHVRLLLSQVVVFFLRVQDGPPTIANVAISNPAHGLGAILGTPGTIFDGRGKRLRVHVNVIVVRLIGIVPQGEQAVVDLACRFFSFSFEGSKIVQGIPTRLAFFKGIVIQVNGSANAEQCLLPPWMGSSRRRPLGIGSKGYTPGIPGSLATADTNDSRWKSRRRKSCEEIRNILLLLFMERRVSRH
mmetsp:Transcript_16918/g.42269  ORF Transcript_16918/g.42269 Transcript_16918/m.42269 type:complete len:215 (+) Transcript_16918:322-966(+)